MAMSIRNQVAAKYGIPQGDCLDNVLTGSVLRPCALCQELKQIQNPNVAYVAFVGSALYKRPKTMTMRM